MNKHTGFHEYKDGKRFNPECLACPRLPSDKLRKLSLLRIRMLKDAIEPSRRL